MLEELVDVELGVGVNVPEGDLEDGHFGVTGQMLQQVLLPPEHRDIHVLVIFFPTPPLYGDSFSPFFLNF